VIIAIDLDGVLCNPISKSTAFDEVKDRVPKEEVVEFLKLLHLKNYQIELYTSRDPSLMMETEQWLSKHKIPYHHVLYGMPRKDIYFGTNSVKYTTREEALEQVKKHGGRV